MHINHPFRFDYERSESAPEPQPRSALAAVAILVAVLAAVVSLMVARHGVPPDCVEAPSACTADFQAG